MSKNKYESYWQQILPELKKHLSDCSGSPRTILLDSQAFESAGERKSSGYSFRMDFREAQVSPGQIKGTAVARDLERVIRRDAEALSLLHRGHFVIRMSKDFVLSVQQL